ncbi:MAG: PAS domain-containing protein [Polyangiaceae bacterium]
MTAQLRHEQPRETDFFRSAATPLAFLGATGIVTMANDAFARSVTGADSVVGRSFASLLRGGDRVHVEASLTALEPGGTVSFDARWEAPVDSAAARSHRFQVTRSDEQTFCVVGVATPAGRGDDARRLALFDRLLDTAPVAFCAIDREGVYTAWEGKGVELVGSKPGDMVGKSALTLWKDTEAFPHLLRALAGEESTAQIALPNGLHIECWYLPIVDDSGACEGTVTFAIDTTAQRKAERELRDKLAIIAKQNDTLTMFSRVLDTAPLVLWAVDAQGNYTMSEGKGLEVLGFRAGEQVGLNALDMFKDNADTARALVQALSGEESRVMATLTPGVHFENWYMPLRARDGSVHGVMGLGIDASERVKGEQELREKLALIERQSATIRALATPIIQVWDEVLCLPVIGTVDSARTADMMQGLLEAIVREQARYAIVDLTGVEVVDTSTADHLIQLFRAAKVLGVDGILCGIRPAVAQTVVALGLELGSVRTMRSLRDALKWCIRVRKEPRSGAGAANASNGAAHANGRALVQGR